MTEPHKNDKLSLWGTSLDWRFHDRFTKHSLDYGHLGGLHPTFLPPLYSRSDSYYVCCFLQLFLASSLFSFKEAFLPIQYFCINPISMPYLRRQTTTSNTNQTGGNLRLAKPRFHNRRSHSGKRWWFLANVFINGDLGKCQGWGKYCSR